MSEGWRMSAKKKGLSFPTERSSSNGGRRVAGLPSKVWVLLQFYTNMGVGVRGLKTWTSSCTLLSSCLMPEGKA